MIKASQPPRPRCVPLISLFVQPCACCRSSSQHLVLKLPKTGQDPLRSSLFSNIAGRLKPESSPTFSNTRKHTQTYLTAYLFGKHKQKCPDLGHLHAPFCSQRLSTSRHRQHGTVNPFSKPAGPSADHTRPRPRPRPRHLRPRPWSPTPWSPSTRGWQSRMLLPKSTSAPSLPFVCRRTPHRVGLPSCSTLEANRFQPSPL